MVSIYCMKWVLDIPLGDHPRYLCALHLLHCEIRVLEQPIITTFPPIFSSSKDWLTLSPPATRTASSAPAPLVRAFTAAPQFGLIYIVNYLVRAQFPGPHQRKCRLGLVCCPYADTCNGCVVHRTA